METEREKGGRHGNALFDHPSLALGELPLLATAQRDGQITLLGLSGVCSCIYICICIYVCVFSPWQKDSKDTSSH